MDPEGQLIVSCDVENYLQTIAAEECGFTITVPRPVSGKYQDICNFLLECSLALSFQVSYYLLPEDNSGVYRLGIISV